MNPVELVARSLEVVVAIGFLYVAWFLYEGQEGRIHDKLAELWIQFDQSRHDRSSTARFIRACAQLSISALDKLFGSNPFTVRFLISAGCLAIFSLLALLLLEPQPFLNRPNTTIAALIFLVAGTLPGTYHKAWAVLPGSVLLTVLIACLTFSGIVDVYGDGSVRSVVLGDCLLLIAFLAAAVFDFAWIVLNRRFIQFAASNNWLNLTIIGLLVSAAASVGLLVGALMDFDFSAKLGRPLGPIVDIFSLIVLHTRLLLAMLAAMVFLTMLIALLYRPLSWVAGKIVYALERNRVIYKQKLFGTLGTGLVLDVLGRNAAIDWLEHVRKLF